MQYAYFSAVTKLKLKFSHFTRVRRMARFLEVMAPVPGSRIIDLGGEPRFWRDCPVPLDITVVNLPGIVVAEPDPGRHRFTLVEGDACDVSFAADGQYDIAFSNSVIEHVGDSTQVARFAAEVHRLAPRHWVQTPSIWFPIEAHTHMPFWWFYPAPLKAVFIRRWRRILPAWCDMIEGTTVLSHSTMCRLFPNSEFWTERMSGLPKSYVAHTR